MYVTLVHNVKQAIFSDTEVLLQNDTIRS